MPKASTPVAPTGGPVTAQEATNSPNVPPVTDSSSGTVTMNIAMTLYGSSMQPFTSDKQFAAASALAGVSLHYHWQEKRDRSATFYLDTNL